MLYIYIHVQINYFYVILTLIMRNVSILNSATLSLIYQGGLKSFSLKSQTTSSFGTGVCYHGNAYRQVCCHGEALYQVCYRDGDVCQVFLP